jgi:hypothetical protein
VTRHFHEKAGAVNSFFSTIKSSRDVPAGAARRKLKPGRNGAEQARARVSAVKRILAGEHRSGIPITVDGRWSGNCFLLVSSELLKFIHNPVPRRFALLPSALFMERFAPVPAGCPRFGNGCCCLGRELKAAVSAGSFVARLAVTRTRRFASIVSSCFVPFLPQILIS